MTEWSSKYRFLDQCSQSLTSRDENSEYLARFYTFNSIKKIYFLLTGQPSLVPRLILMVFLQDFLTLINSYTLIKISQDLIKYFQTVQCVAERTWSFLNVSSQFLSFYSVLKRSLTVKNWLNIQEDLHLSILFLAQRERICFF